MQAIDVTRHSRITQQLVPSTTALSFVCCSQFACKKKFLMTFGTTLELRLTERSLSVCEREKERGGENIYLLNRECSSAVLFKVHVYSKASIAEGIVKQCVKRAVYKNDTQKSGRTSHDRFSLHKNKRQKYGGSQVRRSTQNNILVLRKSLCGSWGFDYMALKFSEWAHNHRTSVFSKGKKKTNSCPYVKLIWWRHSVF